MSMEEEKCVLPLQCKRCGAVFDLWYDLEGAGSLEVDDAFGRQAMKKVLNESLCWNCRKFVLRGMVGRRHASESDELMLSLE